MLHIYNLRDSANIFFKNGIVIAASKGLIEGEDAVRQAFDLKDPHYSWLANAVASMPPYKPVQVNISELLNRHAARKASPERKSAALPVAPSPNPTVESPQPAPPPFLTQTPMPRTSGSAVTTPMARLEAPMTIQTSKPAGSTAPITLSLPTPAKIAVPSPVQPPPEPVSHKKAQYSFIALENPAPAHPADQG